MHIGPEVNGANGFNGSKHRAPASTRGAPRELDVDLGARAVEVTPELAARWLGHNKNVRPVSETRVEALCRMLRTGRWELTHQGVAFDRQGHLVDGQHRLTAIVRSGIAAPMLLVEGLSPTAIGAIDCGASRTAADVLRAIHAELLAGRSAPRFAAICAAIGELDAGSRLKANAELALDVYARHRGGVDWVFGVFPGRHSVPAPIAGALAWAQPTAPEHFDRFGRQLAACYGQRGDAPLPGPALALYSAIVRAQANGDSRLDLMHKTLRAAMAFSRGERVTRLEKGAQGYEFFRQRRATLRIAGGGAGI